MNEPDNHTAWVDPAGDTWVRFDEWPATSWGAEPWGPWEPLTDGPGWEPGARNGVGTPRPWDQVHLFHGPLVQADPERAGQALDRVRQVATR